MKLTLYSPLSIFLRVARREHAEVYRDEKQEKDYYSSMLKQYLLNAAEYYKYLHDNVAVSNGYVTLHRWIGCEDEKSLNFKAVGNYWSNSYEAAKRFGQGSICSHKTILTAKIKVEDLDIELGLFGYMEFPEEEEISTRENSTIEIIAINDKPIKPIMANTGKR